MSPPCFSLKYGVIALILPLILSIPVVRLCGAERGLVSTSPDLDFNPTNGLGSWIWAENTFHGQTCLLWKAFDIPASATVTKIRFMMAADDEFIFYLDGRELGRGSGWGNLYFFELDESLSSGRHILAVQGYNSILDAGMIFGMKVSMSDGQTFTAKSDASWRVVPDDVKQWQNRTTPDDNWPTATIKAPLGGQPWWKTPQNFLVMPVEHVVPRAFWQTGWFQIMIAIVCGLAILLCLRLMAQAALHRKERWLLRRERTRISREIHDEIGSGMTQLVLQGEVAQCALPEDSHTRLELAQICDNARRLLATIDEILWALNPQRDTLQDFAGFVCKYVGQFLKPTAIQCRFQVNVDSPLTALDLPSRRSLLMAIKETVNNVVKHSDATELELQIESNGQRLLVAVQDNGRGFDPALATKSAGQGTTNLQERMKELGGSCTIKNQPGKGCRVEFDVPLTPPNRSYWSWIKGIKRRRSTQPLSHDPSQNLIVH